MHLAKKIKRFLSKIEKDPETKCWNWTGYVGPNGYGACALSGESVAHRWSYKTFVGPIPDGLDLDHLCRNRRCVNPEHLEPVTRAENLRRGEGPKLTSERRRAIKRCAQGHLFSPANTLLRGTQGGAKKGHRLCKKCHYQRWRNWYARKRSEGFAAAEL